MLELGSKKWNELIQRQIDMRDDSSWVGVAATLAAKSIDPNEVVIVTFFSEDVRQEYWLVVDFNKHIYEFYYDWSKSNDESKGEIVEWDDFTEKVDEVYMKDDLQVVLESFEALMKHQNLWNKHFQN